MKLKRYFYTTILIILYCSAFSNPFDTERQHYIDSLLNNVKQYKINTGLRYQAHLDVIDFYRGCDFNKALEHINIALDEAINSQNKQLEYLFRFEIIKNMLEQGNVKQAETALYAQADSLIQLKDNDLLGRYYFLESGIYRLKNKQIDAVETLFISAEYFMEANNIIALSYIYNNIGVSYSELENTELAKANFLKALDYAKNTNHPRILIYLYSNLGIIEFKLNNKKGAKQYLDKSIAISKKTFNLFGLFYTYSSMLEYLDDIEQLETLHKMADVVKLSNSKSFYTETLQQLATSYNKMSKSDSSVFYLKKALKISKKNNDTINIVKTKVMLANIYSEEHNIRKSKQYVADALQYIGATNDIYIKKDIYSILVNINKEAKNYKQAYKYLNLLKHINDSLNRIEIKNSKKQLIEQISLKDKIKIFEKEIHNNKEEYQEQINKQRTRLIIILAILILAVIFGIIYFRNYKKQTAKNKLLQKYSDKIKEQKALAEISNIELQEQYLFTETLLNVIPNPIFYTTKRGDIIGGNYAFLKVAGYDKQSITEKNINDILKAKPYHDSFLCNFTSLEETTDTPYYDKIQYNKNETKHIFLYKKKIIDQYNKTQAILGIVIDVTNIKEAEQKATEALNFKNKFFSIVAHDLKNPFNSVLGLSEILRDELTSMTTDEIKQYTVLINQSVTQIYSLLENLLDWSRLQIGTTNKHFVSFDVDVTIQDTLTLLKNGFADKNIECQYNKQHTNNLFADRNMIQTVIRNIISNAIKFTPEYGKITIETYEQDDNLNIKIADTGVGIPKENIEKIFHFDESVSTKGTNNEKGTGLGLIVSKEFIEDNGGTINVESEVDKGTTFIISLPICSTIS